METHKFQGRQVVTRKHLSFVSSGIFFENTEAKVFESSSAVSLETNLVFLGNWLSEHLSLELPDSLGIKHLPDN